MILCIYPDLFNCMGADTVSWRIGFNYDCDFAKLSIMKQERAKMGLGIVGVELLEGVSRKAGKECLNGVRFEIEIMGRL